MIIRLESDKTRSELMRQEILQKSNTPAFTTSVMLSALEASHDDISNRLWTGSVDSNLCALFLGGANVSTSDENAHLVISFRYIYVDPRYRSTGLSSLLMRKAAYDLALMITNRLINGVNFSSSPIPVDVEYHADCISSAGRRCVDILLQYFVEYLSELLEDTQFIFSNFVNLTTDSY